MIWSVLFAPRSIPWTVASMLNVGVAEPLSYAFNGWCPLSSEVSDGASRALLFAVLGSVL
jgi:hypothetical protein